MLTPTAFLALAMQCAPSVHPETAFDVARVESNFNPYAIAEIIPKAERSATNTRVISHFPANKTEALARIKQIEAKKHRYSVGLMQITSTNFARFGMTAEKLLSPCHNLTVFEKILTDCYRRGGSLKRALSCYYAGDFTTGQQPEAQFAKTSYVERIGYVVPSTRQERTRKEDAPNLKRENFAIWDVLRDFPEAITVTQSDIESKEL
ncbi:lytic transglycosylase domain-containing protein [Arsenophonus apicola]|uniref:lytic transglycosylase domain-containing protein n=1 Tax=Arsenophonus apicola TaxID=2879119 RepID=UPI001CDC9D16|nr:lytic transglycosylase domain-containing protein [Arsenophonus apicola]UBX30765.1 lytic transglycosylase domain-containing protein [Arsenophonus apicola]